MFHFQGISSLSPNSLSTVPLYADEIEFDKSALFFVRRTGKYAFFN